MTSMSERPPGGRWRGAGVMSKNMSADLIVGMGSAGAAGCDRQDGGRTRYRIQSREQRERP
jgi:hypothetical protein